MVFVKINNIPAHSSVTHPPLAQCSHWACSKRLHSHQLFSSLRLLRMSPARPSFSLANILFSCCGLFALLKKGETRHLLQVLKGDFSSCHWAAPWWPPVISGCGRSSRYSCPTAEQSKALNCPQGQEEIIISSLYTLNLIGLTALLFQEVIVKEGLIIAGMWVYQCLFWLWKNEWNQMKIIIQISRNKFGFYNTAWIANTVSLYFYWDGLLCISSS